MKKYTKYIGVLNVAKFLKAELDKYITFPCTVEPCDETQEFMLYKVIFNNNSNEKEYILVNDFEVRADFLYGEEEKIEKKWLYMVNKKAQEVGNDLLKEDAEYKTSQYVQIVKQCVKEFDKKLKNPNLEEDDIMIS